MHTFYVIVASRSRATAEKLAGHLAQRPEFQVKLRIIANGHKDPLHGVKELPELLLMHYGPGNHELEYLAEHGVREQLPLIVCGPVDDPEAMRLAMRAGARDYLPENAPEADFVASVLRIQEETIRARTAGSGKLIVVANGKGGSGASFLATNLAHSLVVDGDHRVTLIDLDLQFGGLSRYLDITPKVGMLQAIDAADEIDEISAQAYTHEHASGLRLLAAPAKHLVLANNISIEKLETVLDAYLSINDYLVADSPSRLDPVTELFFERADKIVIVTQQSLPHVHDSARLLHLLTSEIGIQKKRITVVINRVSKNAPITIADIQKALRTKEVITIPNHYRIASESINSGIPVAEISKTAALSRGIRKLQIALTGPISQPSPGFLKRAMPNFLGG